MDPSVVEIIDDTKNTNLHLLALNGDHEAIERLEDATKKIDVANSYGLTPLMFAARYGHLATVKALLERRADATKVNKYGGSVFLMAVASGNLDIISMLLQHLLSGGVSRQVLETELSPIALAILFGHEHVFKFLVGSRFRVDAISLGSQLTPLMFAALSENPIFSKHLLLLGADAHARNVNGERCADLERRRNGSAALMDSSQQQQQTSLSPSTAMHITLPPPPPPSQPQLLMISPSQHYGQQLSFPRKSSNAVTPEVVTPTISPLGYYPQVFFPTDFTPTQFTSPTLFIPYQHHTTYAQDYIVSPVYTIPSPFTNLHNVNIIDDTFFA